MKTAVNHHHNPARATCLNCHHAAPQPKAGPSELVCRLAQSATDIDANCQEHRHLSINLYLQGK